ncbi:hypothetical protein EVAR_23719_1 [Eumeta japonica]|uniref:Uncharacterized protein n=1 Tax=Eumeta variegata TaxID=151549 RepID=A0A4C1VGT0_EUMVA|nr:hypothetical protein EVAR_23719_1 [Eumeta japonica]
MEKLESGIFDGPQIRQLMKVTDFIKVMTVPESDAWKSFVLVVENFLGNHEALNYEEIVQNMLTNFQTLGANMSIKLHYLRNHLDKFPDNLGNYSEEQGERFHQDLKVMVERYQVIHVTKSHPAIGQHAGNPERQHRFALEPLDAAGAAGRLDWGALCMRNWGGVLTWAIYSDYRPNQGDERQTRPKSLSARVPPERAYK